MAKFEIKKSVMLAIPVLIAAWAIAYVIGWLKLGTSTQLFATVPTTTPFTGTVGNQIIAWIGGIIPITGISGMTWVVLAIGAVVLIMVGMFARDSLRLPSLGLGMKGKAAETATIIVYGSMVMYGILYFMGKSVAPLSAGVIIGLAIYAIAVAYLATFIAGLLKLD